MPIERALGRSRTRNVLILLAGALAAGAPATAGEAETASALRQVVSSTVSRDYQRAIAIARAHLAADRPAAELRVALGTAYALRGRICIPVPPTREAFVDLEAGSEECEASFLAAGLRDTIAAVLAVEVELAPDSIASYLPAVDHEIRYGTPAGLARVLAELGRFDAAAVRAVLLGRLATTRRPGMLAVICRQLLDLDPHHLDCQEAIRLISSLEQVGACSDVLAAVQRVRPDSACAGAFRAAITSALAAGGCHRELWEWTKSVPVDVEPFDYYRYALTAALAAAHFDLSLAGERLEHERVNEASYPEPARELLVAIRSLAGDPAATGAAWAELAERDLLRDQRFADVRLLLRTLALRRNPRLTPVALVLSDQLVRRNIPRAAARIWEEVAGGREPSLDRRWDPHRPDYLRHAAAYYFNADDDAACRALLAAIDPPAPEDDLLAGAAALRAGEPAAARVLLERARAQATVAGLAAVSTRLLDLCTEP